MSKPFDASFSYPSPLPKDSYKDSSKSRAYINAMKSLQDKIKELEREKTSWEEEKKQIFSTVEMEYEKITQSSQKELNSHIEKENSFLQKIENLQEEMKLLREEVEEREEEIHEVKNQNDRKVESLLKDVQELKLKLSLESNQKQELTAEGKNLREEMKIKFEEYQKNIEKLHEINSKLMIQQKEAEHRIVDLEQKNQTLSQEINTLQNNYNLDLKDYQNEIVILQKKYEADVYSLEQARDALIQENKKLQNESNLKDEDYEIIRKKLETLQNEKKKDDLLKQVYTQMNNNYGIGASQIVNIPPPPLYSSRNNPNFNNEYYFKSQLNTENPREVKFNNNASDFINDSQYLKKFSKHDKKNKTVEKKKDYQRETPQKDSDICNSSSDEDFSSDEKEKKKKETKSKNKKKTIPKEEFEIKQIMTQNKKEKNLINAMEIEKNGKEILFLENEIEELNRQYNKNLNESQVIYNSSSLF